MWNIRSSPANSARQGSTPSSTWARKKGLGKQLQYANRQQIPVAVILGSDEFAKNEVTLKDLKLGGLLQEKKKGKSGQEREEYLKLSRTAQVTVPRAELLQQVKEMLGRPTPLS